MMHAMHTIHIPHAPVPPWDTRSPQTRVAYDCHTGREKDDPLVDTTLSPDSTRSHPVAFDNGCVAGVAVVGTFGIGHDGRRHECDDAYSNDYPDNVHDVLVSGHFGHHRLWWWMMAMMAMIARPLRVVLLVRHTARRMRVRNRCDRVVCVHQAHVGVW